MQEFRLYKNLTIVVALITNSQAKELNYWLAAIAVVLFGLFTRMTVGAMKQIDKDLDELKRLDQ